MSSAAGAKIVDLTAYRLERTLQDARQKRDERQGRFLLWYPGIGYVQPFIPSASVSRMIRGKKHRRPF